MSVSPDHIAFSDAEWQARAEAATAFCHAVAKCHPDDAAVLMVGILPLLGVGAPVPPLLGYMDAARDWARFATVPELKAHIAAAVEQLPSSDRRAALAYVQGVA